MDKMTSNAKRDAAAEAYSYNQWADRKPECEDVYVAFKTGWNARDAEVAELMAQVEFCKMYYKPDDTSFKTMIETFVELSDEQKDALIELTKALLKTKDAK